MRLRASPLALGGIAVLAASNIWLLLITIGQIVTDDKAVAADEASWVPRLAKFDTAETQATPAAAHQDILAHPLFSRSRAPFVPAPPPPPKATQQQPAVFTDPALVLGGVILNGETKKAYLSQKSSHDSAWVGEGENFAGWKVQSITVDGTTLQKDNHTIEVRLYPDR
jgi:hypothetical protein